MRLYKLVENSSVDGLNAEVNILLKNGWDCWGNPFVAQVEFDTHVHFFQAMVKVEYEHDRISSTSGKRQAIHVAGYNVSTPEMPMEITGQQPDADSHFHT